jgi:hypothetical protein
MLWSPCLISHMLFTTLVQLCHSYYLVSRRSLNQVPGEKGLVGGIWIPIPLQNKGGPFGKIIFTPFCCCCCSSFFFFSPNPSFSLRRPLQRLLYPNSFESTPITNQSHLTSDNTKWNFLRVCMTLTMNGILYQQHSGRNTPMKTVLMSNMWMSWIALLIVKPGCWRRSDSLLWNKTSPLSFER